MNEAPNSLMLFSPASLRAARALMDWTRVDTGSVVGVSPETIKNIENDIYKPTLETQKKIVRTFADHGVEFLGCSALSKFGLDVEEVRRITFKGPMPDDQDSAIDRMIEEFKATFRAQESACLPEDRATLLAFHNRLQQRRLRRDQEKLYAADADDFIAKRALMLVDAELHDEETT